jgi:hypothetical protein
MTGFEGKRCNFIPEQAPDDGERDLDLASVDGAEDNRKDAEACERHFPWQTIVCAVHGTIREERDTNNKKHHLHQAQPRVRWHVRARAMISANMMMYLHRGALERVGLSHLLLAARPRAARLGCHQGCFFLTFFARNA